MPHLLPLLMLLLLAGGLPARALESDATASPRATVTLVSEVDAVAPGRPFRIGLRQRLAPGWHTYWTNPGDAGQPPEVTLALPEGATAGPLRFPAPHRIPYGPLVNFGYEGEALFTMEVTPPASLPPGTSFALQADATWLVCERICIPEEGRFRLEIPVATAPAAAPQAPLFTAAEAAEAQPSPFTVRAGFQGSQGALEVSGPGLAPGAVRDAFFFPADWGVLEHAAPQPMTLREGSLRLGLIRGQSELPGSLGGILVITDAAGVRGAWNLAAAPGAVPAGGEALPLWLAMLFALLGGLILNVMPCVFPVLAMKAMALARMSGAARATVRAHAASYTAGVVLSFLAMGGALLALRAAGGMAGWGFQFTSPVFVAGLALLMLGIGLNLSGVYAMGATMGGGGDAAARGGHAGSFFTGALAVLVATPCTAPFMATAVGAALAMPPAATLAVFGALGLGLALPYALLGLVPGLARLLPRPGPWMERLRQGLAFPMYGAAAWLAWVLAQQAGADGVLAVLAGAVLVGFAAWAWGQAQRAGITGRRIVGGLALLSLVATCVLVAGLRAAPPAQATADAEAWSAARVAALRAEGRPVFVNLTAAWCVTCKVNERVALQGAAVREAFAARGVTYLKGDWTNGDAAITALLRAQGRDGVPLYLFYPAGGGDAVVLPQILTEGIVLRAMAGADS